MRRSAKGGSDQLSLDIRYGNGRRYTEAEFREAVANADTISDVCRALGLVPRGGNYESIRDFALARTVSIDHLGTDNVKTPSLGTDNEGRVRDAVACSRSLAAAIRQLGGEPNTTNYRRIRRAIERYDLDTSHFSGRGWARGRTMPNRWRKPISEVLVENSRAQTSKLRERLIHEGLKERRCEACGRDSWDGAPIPLELDHINGRRRDNRLQNLRLLCPNCHALTPTYRGRNIGNAN
jgi:5-methylcytosine-specific restriction endonuclease McrA